ncbi:hypothetical protein [Pedobacter psychrodurus]|uniref:hypothetical protein n=1 Tax=Pedobacter psychrodurus TaxID=2530456 RepID=UPI0019801658|nr:hypothetical protein [Pedobacter psychrodurus]
MAVCKAVGWDRSYLPRCPDIMQCVGTAVSLQVFSVNAKAKTARVHRGGVFAGRNVR